MATIEEKLRTILSADDTGGGPIGRCANRPRLAAGEFLSDFELDLRDWGCVYGMAFAMARFEDPFESTETVAERALQAAESAFTAYGGHTNAMFAARGQGRVSA